MEEITIDYWKDIIRGVASAFLVTLMSTATGALLKYSATLGYATSVILTFRGITTLVCCLVESTIYTNKTTKKRECNVFRIITNIKSIGILPRRTKIPLFNDSSMISISRSNLRLDQTLSYSLLSTNNEPPITPKMIHKKKRRIKSYRCLIWTAIIMRGIIGGISCWFSFEAARLLPVGDYLALLALSATITPLFAFVVFRDTLSKLHALSLIGAMGGVILIVQPPFMFGKSENIDTSIIKGYIFAISTCISNAFVFICIQFARKVPIYMLGISQSIGTLTIGMVLLILDHEFMDKNTVWLNNWYDVACILMIGFAGYGYLLFLTSAGRYLSSGVIALLMNLSIVWGYLVQVLFFDETPGWITMIGAICMFLSAVIVSGDKVNDAKKKSMSVIERNITTNVATV